MRFSNLHTHSTFSDGKNTPAEIAEAAAQRNFLSIGFSDHSDTPCDQSYCMKQKDYPAYFRTVRELKKQWDGRMDVLLGLELDYYSDIDREPFDYIIASVHYICKDQDCYPIDHSLRQQQDCIARLCGGSRLEMAKRYYDLLLRHVAASRPDIVGHFDVITKFGLYDDADPAYEDLALQTLDEVLKICPRVEMNTGAIARGVRTAPYPAPFLLQRILERGGKILLSSDSHAADTLDCYFPESVDLLRRVGFRDMLILDRNGFREILL